MLTSTEFRYVLLGDSLTTTDAVSAALFGFHFKRISLQCQSLKKLVNMSAGMKETKSVLNLLEQSFSSPVEAHAIVSRVHQTSKH